MSKPSETLRIEVKTQDQAAILNYAFGLVHQHLSSRLEDVEDNKLDSFMDNIKWTRKHANSLNDKFSLIEGFSAGSNSVDVYS